MRDDANQLAGDVARQTRVAVERDAVAHLRQNREVADLHGEAGVGGATQQTVELFDLAAFPFPAHPEAFLRVPLAEPMEEQKAAGAFFRVLGVQRADARARRGEDLGILRQRLRRRIWEIAEKCEVEMAIEVAD